MRGGGEIEAVAHGHRAIHWDSRHTGALLISLFRSLVRLEALCVPASLSFIPEVKPLKLNQGFFEVVVSTKLFQCLLIGIETKLLKL